MNGLIYKDLINLKQQGRSYFFIVAVWAALSVMQKNPYFFAGMSIIYTMMIPLSACAYDEKNGWERYALTMPVTRRELILSKYLLALLVTIVCGLIIAVFFLAMGKSPSELLIAECVCQAIGFVMEAIMFPLIFKFGTEKARYMIVAIYMLPMILVYMLVQAGFSLPELGLDELKRLMYLALAAGLCLFGVSALVSIRIYEKKEF